MASIDVKPYSYEAGVCNIGPAEIRARRMTGWAGLLVTVLLLALLVAFHAGHWWRLFVFLPASMSASGFLQAYFHFCSGFGMQGVYNFKDKVGKTEKVTDSEALKKDRSKSLRIALYSAAVGAAVTVMAFFLPL
jgi:hypothetical protein